MTYLMGLLNALLTITSENAHVFDLFDSISRNLKIYEEFAPEGCPKPPGIGVILVWAL